MKKWISLGIIIFLAILFRLFRLETNSHFLADEARDLVNIHQIFVDKKLTLVGPISDDGQHLFSSLTYYLLLPFAVIFHFQPLGTVIGAVFWGIITFIVLWILAIKINSSMLIPSGILAALWWPLVQTSRWPWNPNFVPLWISLSIYFSLFKSKKYNLLSGISAGISLHHHFLAIIASSFVWLKKRSLLWIIGSFLAILPFIIFDNRHPPGLFFTKLITYGGGQPLKIIDIIPRYFSGLFYSLNYLFPIFTIVISLIILTIFIIDIKTKSKNIYWGVSFLLSLSIFIFYSHQPQYIFGAIPLFWMWLFLPRQNLGKILTYILIFLICLSSLVKYSQEIFKDDFTGNLSLVSGASSIIKQQITNQKLQNANLAVLGCVDQEGLGKRYRGVLLTWNVPLKSKDEYSTSDNLFVITQTDAQTLRTDHAAQISSFRQGPAVGSWDIPHTNWRVIQFNRY